MLPNNPEIEKSVLGCLLMGKQDYVIKLSELDFMSETNRTIYKAIRKLYDKKEAIDIITVSDAIGTENALEIVADLNSYVASPENIEYYISKLKTYTMRREVIKAAIKAKEMAEGDKYESAVELKNDVLQVFDIPVYDGKKTDNSISAIMPAVLQDIEDRHNAKNEDKLFTAYDAKMTAGLHPEELTIIAARPGVGKTAYAIQMMLNMAKKGVKCLFVSREMSQMQIAKRIIANIATVDGQKLRFCKSLTDEDWKKLAYATSDISRLPIELNDKLASIQEIGLLPNSKQKQHRLFHSDHLHYAELKKTENRRQETEDIQAVKRNIT